MAALLWTTLGLPGVAAADTAHITEFRLPGVPSNANSLAAGPDGQMWFGAAYVHGDPRPGYGELVREVDRIAPDGTVGAVVSPQAAEGLIRGPNGNVWFIEGAHIDEIAASGEVTDFPLLTTLFPSTTTLPRALAFGPDGNLWFTAEHEVANNGGPPTTTEVIGRMTPAGQVSEFPLAGRELGLGAIAAGPDEAMWFVERNTNKIGRITTGGDISEFPIPTAGAHPSGIATGSDGGIWFTEQRLHPPAAIGRIDPSGRIRELPLSGDAGYPGQIVLGPDGRLWFTYGVGAVGTIAPNGHSTRIALPRRTQVRAIATGPEGGVWYAAAGDPPCEGGGGTCTMRIPREPGVVGRIEPASLSIRIAGSRAMFRGRRAMLKLVCEAGEVGDLCRGALRLQVRRPGRQGRRMALLAKRRYAIPTDRNRTIGLSLGHEGWLLSRRRSRIGVLASLETNGGETIVRRLVLHRRPVRRHRSHRRRR